jgi:hypothetical protein
MSNSVPIFFKAGGALGFCPTEDDGFFSGDFSDEHPIRDIIDTIRMKTTTFRDFIMAYHLKFKNFYTSFCPEP